MIEALVRLLRRIPLFRRVERAVWQIPQPYAAVVTALGHGLLTALSGPLAPYTAFWYTRRELRSVRDRGYSAPEYDHVSDVVVPWLVVVGYAVLVTWILR